jgi:hypothetical protein
MNWESDELRATALRLLLSGSVSANKIAEPLLDELDELGMVAHSRRAGEFVLCAGHKERLRRYLAVRWPQVDEAEAAFVSRPETISAVALRALRRAPLALPSDLRQLNRRTWSAWAGAHSKSGFCTPPDGVVLTTDEGLRLRANAGMQIGVEEGAALDVDVWQTLFGEVIVPERAFARDWGLWGVMPELVLTVENLGAFVDFPSPPWLLLVHAPGRNTALATKFVSRLPGNIPWAHFGDMDPAGLKIAMSIHRHGDCRSPVPWVPRAAAELLETHTLPLESSWPEQDLTPGLLDNLVIKWLIKHQRWLEHEAVVLLPGFAQELTELAQRCKYAVQT